MMAERQKGRIKTLKDKGFGFITPADGGKDVFFHASDLDNCEFDALSEGVEVSFHIEKGKEGKNKAVEVRM